MSKSVVKRSSYRRSSNFYRAISSSLPGDEHRQQQELLQLFCQSPNLVDETRKTASLNDSLREGQMHGQQENAASCRPQSAQNPLEEVIRLHDEIDKMLSEHASRPTLQELQLNSPILPHLQNLTRQLSLLEGNASKDRGTSDWTSAINHHSSSLPSTPIDLEAFRPKQQLFPQRFPYSNALAIAVANLLFISVAVPSEFISLVHRQCDQFLRKTYQQLSSAYAKRSPLGILLRTPLLFGLIVINMSLWICGRLLTGAVEVLAPNIRAEY